MEIECGRRASSGQCDPLHEPSVDPPYDIDQPRMVPYRINWRRHQDAVYWFDLDIAIFLNESPEQHRLHQRSSHVLTVSMNKQAQGDT